MAWTAEELRTYRQLPQSLPVIQRALTLAEEDCDRINPRLVTGSVADQARRDRAVEQLVRIDLEPARYSGNYDGGVLVNSLNDARSKILLSLVGAATVIQDSRRRPFPPRYTA